MRYKESLLSNTMPKNLTSFTTLIWFPSKYKQGSLWGLRLARKWTQVALVFEHLKPFSSARFWIYEDKAVIVVQQNSFFLDLFQIKKSSIYKMPCMSPLRTSAWLGSTAHYRTIFSDDHMITWSTNTTGADPNFYFNGDLTKKCIFECKYDFI